MQKSTLNVKFLLNLNRKEMKSLVFSSLLFLFYFLPVVMFLYFAVPRKYKNLILFISSLFFYAWGEPIYIVLMLFSTIVDYTHGLKVEEHLKNGDRRKAKRWVISSAIINLMLLGFFKYTDFLLLNINQLFQTNIPLLNLPLPIGISFYTFQTMSYTIDVYRGEAKAQKNMIDFGAYVALFPQLVAGPIVQYKTIADQLNNRKETYDMFSDGVNRFILGLGKKVLIANNMGWLFTEISSQLNSDFSTGMAWLGVLAFTLQIYFDFSGYSDMAIGLGKMFGFTFDENFKYPFISTSASEFWRRWHISLGSWFRDYAYIPLGGNRKGLKRTYINLAIVWFITGFWHGASWNFVLWGVYYGIFICLEKAFLLKWLKQIPKALQHAYLIFITLVGFTIFAFDDFNVLQDYLSVMFGFSNKPIINSMFFYYSLTHFVLILIAILISTPIAYKTYQKLTNHKNKLLNGLGTSILVIIFFISLAYLVDATYNPFLYFRF